MLITVVTASVILYLRGQSGQELRLIKAAEKALKSSDFEEACYTYASALLRTPSQYYSKKHIAKINELWRNHGPFTFDRKKRDLEAAIENLRQEGDTKECCGESGLAMEWVFHEIILEKIQEIVENRVTGISWPRKVKIIQLWEVTSGPLGTIVKLAPQNKV
jgi:HEPN domain-containing protein